MSAVALSDIVRDRGLVGGPFGSSLGGKDYVPNGVPVIRGINLGLGRTVGGEFVYVSEQKFSSELWRNDAKPGDLVLTQRGTLGQVAIVPDEPFSRYVISQSQMRLRVDPARAVANYVYYACSSAGFNRQIHDRAIATGVPHINLGILSKLTIPLPSLAQQRGIAELLGALDDKIAANTALARTADELVRTRYLGMELEARDHALVSDVVTAVGDKVEPGSLDSATPYIGLEHIPRRMMWLAGTGAASAVTSTKSAFMPNDVLFGKLRPYFHKVVAVPSSGVCSTDVLVLRPRDPELFGFVLAALTSDRVVERSTAASEGTRMPRTSWKDLARIDIAWPGVDNAQAFSRDIHQIHDAITAQMKENLKLAETRDALLPALMSGRLRVKDAEAVAGSVL